MTAPDSQFADTDWVLLEAALGAFVAAWDEGGTPPVIGEYLDDFSPDCRLPAAVEMIKVDLEQRWQRGLRRLIEDYFTEIPDLVVGVPPELLFEEYHTRKLAGDAVSPTEYFTRFPDQSSALAELFRVDPQLRSTLVVDAVQVSRLDLQPGETIDDFDLLLRVGQGAFATVFLARQRSMQRIVALKVSADEGTEPQTLAQLDHDNIIRVYDQRLIPERRLRLLYMQYASGGTLADILHALRSVPRMLWSGREYLRALDRGLEDRGESPPSDSSLRRKIAGMRWSQLVCWLGSQLAAALDYAHRRGVLHRDLKPANILLTSEGLPKLADFNISFASQLEGTAPEDHFGGSIAYMSPEQLEACNPRHDRHPSSLDGRSDLYSLGVVLWELLIGDRPFLDPVQGPRWGTRLEQMTILRRGGPRFDAIVPLVEIDIPGMDGVLRQCLASEPSARYASGRALAFALESCLQPELHRLLSGPTKGWKLHARQAPLLAVITATILPNAVAAVFNFLYNRGEIIERIPDALPTFMRIQSIINLIAFPAGASCAWWLAGSVAKATSNHLPLVRTAEFQVAQRQRCLELGHLAAMVSLTLWVLAAPAYPTALHLIRGSVPMEVYATFIASLVLCGLIAMAYPFFGVTLIAVRSFYPTLLHWETVTRADLAALERLGRQTWFYLVLAASVPMLSVVCLVLCGQDRRFALVVLAVAGLLGFGIAISVFRWLQRDIALLTTALSREDRSST